MPNYTNGGGSVYLYGLVNNLNPKLNNNMITSGIIPQLQYHLDSYEKVIFCNVWNPFSKNFLRAINLILNSEIIHSHGRFNYPLIIISWILRKKIIHQYHGYYGFDHESKISRFFGVISDQLINLIVTKIIFNSDSEMKMGTRFTSTTRMMMELQLGS